MVLQLLCTHEGAAGDMMLESVAERTLNHLVTCVIGVAFTLIAHGIPARFQREAITYVFVYVVPLDIILRHKEQVGLYMGVELPATGEVLIPR